MTPVQLFFAKNKNLNSFGFVCEPFTYFRFGFIEPVESGPDPDLVSLTPDLCSGAGRYTGQTAAVGHGRSGEIQVARYLSDIGPNLR
jgi:hypothetical protein